MAEFDSSNFVPTPSSKLMFFNYGCCVPTWEALWIVIVLGALLLCSCTFCGVFTLFVRWTLLRNTKKSLESIEANFKEEQAVRRAVCERVCISDNAKRSDSAFRPLDSQGFQSALQNSNQQLKSKNEGGCCNHPIVHLPSAAFPQQCTTRANIPSLAAAGNSSSRMSDNTEKTSNLVLPVKIECPQFTIPPSQTTEVAGVMPPSMNSLSQEGSTVIRMVKKIRPKLIAASAHCLARYNLPSQQYAESTSSIVLTEGDEINKPTPSSSAYTPASNGTPAITTSTASTSGVSVTTETTSGVTVKTTSSSNFTSNAESDQKHANKTAREQHEQSASMSGDTKPPPEQPQISSELTTSTNATSSVQQFAQHQKNDMYIDDVPYWRNHDLGSRSPTTKPYRINTQEVILRRESSPRFSASPKENPDSILRQMQAELAYRRQDRARTNSTMSSKRDRAWEYPQYFDDEEFSDRDGQDNFHPVRSSF